MMNLYFSIYIADSFIIPGFFMFATPSHTSLSPLIATTTSTNAPYYLLIHIPLIQFIFCITHINCYSSAFETSFYLFWRLLSALFAFRKVRISNIKVVR